MDTYAKLKWVTFKKCIYFCEFDYAGDKEYVVVNHTLNTVALALSISLILKPQLTGLQVR